MKTDESQRNVANVASMPARNRFDFFWQLNAPLFEPPNTCRGGWSGVSQIQLQLNNEKIPVFIKRQRKHRIRYWRHLLKGIPTFEREYRNIKHLRALDIPTLEPVFFAKRKDKAILITKALSDYQSLDELDYSQLSFPQRSALICSIAKVIAKLHAHHLQHNCLYPKHIFVKQLKNKSWDVRLIDLEKLRHKLFKRQALSRDLSCLSRHAPDNWSQTDHLRFFKAYLGQNRLTPAARILWQQIALKVARKRR